MTGQSLPTVVDGGWPLVHAAALMAGLAVGSRN